VPDRGQKKERKAVCRAWPAAVRPSSVAGAEGAAQPRRRQFVEGRRSQGVLFGGVGVLVFAQSLASGGVRGVAVGRTRGRGAFTLYAPRISHSVHGAMIRVVSGVILPECPGAPLGPGPPCLDEVAEAGGRLWPPPQRCSAEPAAARARAPCWGYVRPACSTHPFQVGRPGRQRARTAAHRQRPAPPQAGDCGPACVIIVCREVSPLARAGEPPALLFCGPRCCPLCHPQQRGCGVRDGAGQLPGACSRPAARLRLGRQPLGKDQVRE